MGAEAAGRGVAIQTLGCKVNRTESESYAESLLEHGAALAEDPHGARVIVVNTCTVTAEADAKARKAVRRALQQIGGDGAVVVTGCLAAVDPDGLRSLGDRVLVVPAHDQVAARVLEAMGAPLDDPPPTPAPRAAARIRGGGSAFRTRVMVKVQDGCDRRCAYCIVPDARGGPRSERSADVVDRVRRLVEAGTREIVLTGIDIGRYRDPGAGSLAGLVAMLAATGIPRIRVSSVEPVDLTAELLQAIGRTPAVMPHLHVPLQSGSDRVLSAMGRGYDTRSFARAIDSARAAVPGLVVTTDVIAGFPGETDAEFEESLEFARSCGFVKLHAFRYSRRAGTPAATMPDQVDPRTIAARAARLRALSEELQEAHAASRAGGTAQVLIERADGRSGTGTSEDYLRVRVDAAGLEVGDVVAVRLSGAVDGVVPATPADPEGLRRAAHDAVDVGPAG